MPVSVISYGLTGLEGYAIEVQVDIAAGLPRFDTVGLPDAAVKESRDRVRTALRNCGINADGRRVTVNLSPAHVKKEGPIYDLPIAVGLMAAYGRIKPEALRNTLFLGELALDGRVMPITGVLPMLIAAREQGFAQVVLPPGNASEASFVEGMKTYAPRDLQTLVSWLRRETVPDPVPVTDWQALHREHAAGQWDLSMVRGQQAAKRALEIAAAGGHNLLMIGPPGSGKTLLARCLPSILPDLTFDEALEVTKIHSVAGVLSAERPFVTTRPFRAPHHTVSAAALTGGGVHVRPGEVSLGHHGVLFLDELPEFHHDALEALRQPLEDGFVQVTRVSGSLKYPARLMLVAAMNPCPCGYYGNETTPCRCGQMAIRRYLGKISGPLLDRVDLQIEVDGVPLEQLESRAPEESSAIVRQRVNAARQRQLQRYRALGLFANAALDSRGVEQFCPITPEGNALLTRAAAVMTLTPRAYHRILKVARTIADLAGEADIAPAHLAEAISYRSLDRKYW